MIFKAIVATKKEYFKYYIVAKDKTEVIEKLRSKLEGMYYRWYEVEQVNCDLIVT